MYLLIRIQIRFGTEAKAKTNKEISNRVQMVFKKNDGYKREPVVNSFISSDGQSAGLMSLRPRVRAPHEAGKNIFLTLRAKGCVRAEIRVASTNRQLSSRIRFGCNGYR